nr:hypothetical protein [Kofleriaceae bacterium]
MRAAAAAMAVVACGRFGFATVTSLDDAPAAARGDSAAADAPGSNDVGSGSSGSGYRANAVRFASAGGDYMTTGSLANVVDSPAGTYSVWLRFEGADDTQQMLGNAQLLADGGVFRTAAGKLRFLMQNCGGLPLLDMETAPSYGSAAGWIHVLASWDVSAGKADLYVDDVPQLAANPTVLAGTICYGSLKWGFGGLAGNELDADVADLYAALGTYVDLAVTANRRKFADAAGKPVALGATCELPTGATPTGCFTGSAATWNHDLGRGGGFTLFGDGLTAAPTSPSD